MAETVAINGVELQPRQVDLLNLTKAHKFTLAYGVSRGGKSFLFILLMIARALMYPKSNHCVVRQTQSSIDSTIWATVLSVIDALDPDYRSKLEINLNPRRITFDNGSMIWFHGCQDDEAVMKLMGSEYATIFMNECVHFTHKIAMKLVTRLNSNAFKTRRDGTEDRIPLRLYADCNPEAKSHWVYQQYIEKVIPGTKNPLFNPDAFAELHFDRDANSTVADGYYDEMQNYTFEEQMSYLKGEWRDAIEGALFSAQDLNDNREDPPQAFDTVIVGVDPAVSNSPTSDETGIITLGCVHTDLPDGTTRRDVYPLDDSSGRWHPHEWAAKVRDAYTTKDAAAVVVEINQGGDMNVFTIKGAHPRANILTVRPGGNQGKNMRAAPIAREMRDGRIHFPHSTKFKELEAQLLAMTGDYDRKRNKSPDRLDAFVYAAAELLDGDGGPSKVVASTAVGFWR